jgi:hypothetical protein
MAYISFTSFMYNYIVVVIEKFKKLVSEILLSNFIKCGVTQYLTASITVYIFIWLFKYFLLL